MKVFLGLLSWYRQIIKDFAKITVPFIKCLKKNWIENLSCFETYGNLLIKQPVLQHPDVSRPFNIYTDVSNVALGAVHSQKPIFICLEIMSPGS